MCDSFLGEGEEWVLRITFTAKKPLLATSLPAAPLPGEGSKKQKCNLPNTHGGDTNNGINDHFLFCHAEARSIYYNCGRSSPADGIRGGSSLPLRMTIMVEVFGRYLRPGFYAHTHTGLNHGVH